MDFTLTQMSATLKLYGKRSLHFPRHTYAAARHLYMNEIAYGGGNVGDVNLFC